MFKVKSVSVATLFSGEKVDLVYTVLGHAEVFHKGETVQRVRFGG